MAKGQREGTLRALVEGQMGTRICSTFGKTQKWEYKHPYTIRKSAELNNFKKSYTDELFFRICLLRRGPRH
jgi:hypothetical protein